MTRAQQAFEFFIQQGWSPEQSAGIVANLQAESGFRHDAVGDGGAAYGIAQWHPPRQAGFEALLGKPIRGSSFEDQLYWVHAELQSTESRAGHELGLCYSASEAGACVSMRYERPADIEGEAKKRAALAETILQNYAGATISPEPLPAPPGAAKPPQTPDLPPYRTQPENSMLPALLLQLLPAIINGFSPAGQTQLQPMTGRPVDQLLPFAIDLFSKIAQTTGTLPAGQPVKTDAEAIAAVAEYNKLKTTNTALVGEIEAHALDYLDKVGPLIREIHKMEVERKELSIKGKDAAGARARLDRWDMTKALVRSSEGLAWMIVLGGFSGVGAAIYVAQYQLALAILGIVGTITGGVLKNRSQVYDYRFDGTEASAAINISTDAVARALPQKL
jgi:hypothetical protein